MTFSLKNRDADGPVDVCVNLRYDSKGVLTPALPPGRLPAPEGWTPLAGVNIAGVNRILMKKGAQIGLLSGADIPHPLSLADEADFAFAVGRNIIVGGKRRVARLYVDESTLSLAEVPDYETILPSLRAVDAGYVTASVAPVKVNPNDARNGILSAAESRAISDSVREAYGLLDEAARSTGVCWQPMLACVRAVDADGNQLFATEPVLLSHPSGSEFGGVFEFVASSDGAYAVAPDASAPAWRPALDVPAPLLDALPSGAIVQILVSPPLYGHDDVSRASVSARRRADAHLATAVLHASRRNIREMLGSLDRSLSVGWESRRPEVYNDVTLDIPSSQTRTSSATLSEGLFSIQSAKCGALAANAVVWGAPVLRHPVPPKSSNYALSVGGVGSWHGVVAVDFADGSRLVSTDEGLTAAPLVFSPLISYPSADAVAITFIVSAAGEVRTQRFSLVADPSGRRAFAIHPSGRPFQLADRLDFFAVPSEIESPAVLSRKIALASSADPTTVIATADASDIMAIVAANSGQSSWDFGRSRFYVFSSSGVHLLNVDIRRASMSMSLIDSRILDSSTALARIDDGLAAMLSSDLVVLSGSRVKRLTSVADVAALAWNHADHELWCVRPNDVEVVCFAHNYDRYTMPLKLTADTVQGAFDTSYAVVDSDGARWVCRVGHNRFGTHVAVEWRGKPFALGSPPEPSCSTTLSRLKVSLPGDYDSLVVDITRANGSADAPAPDLRLELTGRVTAPLEAALVAPPFASRLYSVALSASASPSSRFFGIF